MSVQDYVGSLAQTSISYTTLINVQTTPGQNYYQVGLFVESVADAVNNLAPGYTINVPIAITSSNYTAISKVGSPLASWLQSFFQVNSISTVYVVVYNGVTHDIASAHSALLTLCYFKMVFFGIGGETTQYNNDVVALAGQGAGNRLLTQVLVSTSNVLVLLPSGSGSGTLDQLIVASGYDAMMTYSAVTAFNELLTAVGVALSYTNSTGTPVANDLDFNYSSFLIPSANNGLVNLTSVQVANLGSRSIGYFSTVGDGTGNVYMNCRFTLRGQVVTANWLVNYANFVCSLKTATLLTTPGQNTFKNNPTYQQILSIINAVLSPFQSGSIGRLQNFSITAVPFSQLPISGGTVLNIPNAWSANFLDRIGSVAVNGTLNVTL